jgi:hypothetical protein
VKSGDLVRASWSDGLTLLGRYFGVDRGYVVLVDEDGNKIVCNKSAVQFEVINESR